MRRLAVLAALLALAACGADGAPEPLRDTSPLEGTIGLPGK